MSIDNIAIIGAGQIGRRHLQALKLIDRPVNIQVVDPNQESLQKAKELYVHSLSTKHYQKVEYLNSISSLSTDLNLAIISTTANVREKVLENLLKDKKVKYLILEKVVFQHEDSFSRVDSLMKDKKVEAWVNCPLRMYPFFKDLKKRITKSSSSIEKFSYQISGSHWNLASNAIHHLDLFSYLSNESNIRLDSSLLDTKILNSKRKGFIEVTGSLFGKGEKGSNILLTSYPEGNAPLLIQVNTPSTRCIVNLTKQKAFISEQSTNWEWSEITCQVPYQSQLTHLVVQNILDEGNCDLPSYLLSWNMHLPLLYSLRTHLKSHSDWSLGSCPIS